MKFGFPYRPPCGGWPAKPQRWASCYQHYRDAESHIPVYANLTTVPDYHTPPGSDIAPYPRPNSAYSDESGSYCGGTNQPPCGPWPESEIPTPVFSESPTSYINQARCRKLGFKAVTARKSWHGRLPFDVCPGDPDHCHFNTKYRTVTRHLSYSYVFIFGVITRTYDITLHRVYTVDRYSGIITATGYDDVTTNETDPGRIADIVYDARLWLIKFNSCVTDADLAELNYNNDTEDQIDNQTVTRSSTRVDLVKHGSVYGGSEGSIDITLSVELSDPYSITDVRSDLYGLLGSWNLGDDIQYPWRIDDHVTVNPFVCYHEPTAVNPDCGNDVPWTDPNAAIYTGHVQGEPLIHNAPFFDFRCPVNDFWNADGPHWYIKEWGAPRPSYLPDRATQWVDNFNAAFLYPPGAFEFSDSNGVIHAGKWIEAFVRRPSQNWCRPCGSDRLAIDQVSAECDGEELTGVLRYTDPVPPAICGRIAVKSAYQDNTQVTIILEEPALFLNEGDHVDFTGLYGLSNNAEVMDMSGKTQFGVMGTLSIPFDPTKDTAYISSTGAPPYWFNDEGSKGDYVTTESISNYRAHGEWIRLGSVGPEPELSTVTSTQRCHGFTPCSPTCIGWSPNTETGLSLLPWNSQDFGDCYTVKWQACVHQHMPEVFWQPPHVPCDFEGEGTWLEDQDLGSACSPDSGVVRYYPQRPWVEAMLAPPEGIMLPNVMPGDDRLSMPTYGVPGVVGNYPDTADPAEVHTPWGILLREHHCTRTDFIPDYIANGSDR